jgi:hypothetical protein
MGWCRLAAARRSRGRRVGAAGVRMVRNPTGQRKAVVRGEATKAASAIQNGHHSCWAALRMREGARAAH